ncbi:hypothetical protein [uncultured Algibacter sp.]
MGGITVVETLSWICDTEAHPNCDSTRAQTASELIVLFTKVVWLLI